MLLQFLPLLGLWRRIFDAAVAVARAWDVPGAKVGTAALTTEVMVLAKGGARRSWGGRRLSVV